MKVRAALVLLSFLTVALANAQSSPRASNQENGVPESWVDSSTGLTWAGKDNGKDVSWKSAVKYCRELRLAGYSDWRLATLAELEGIYDLSATSPGLARLGGPPKGSDFVWHVKGNLFLTGDEWSSSEQYDDLGHPSGYEWYFDFNEGHPDKRPDRLALSL